MGLLQPHQHTLVPRIHLPGTTVKPHDSSCIATVLPRYLSRGPASVVSGDAPMKFAADSAA